jgi:hypothetical protein
LTLLDSFFERSTVTVCGIVVDGAPQSTFSRVRVRSYDS